MTSENFLGFMITSSLSAFCEAYQYCSSTKLDFFLAPPPSPLCGWSFMYGPLRDVGVQGWAESENESGERSLVRKSETPLWT